MPCRFELRSSRWLIGAMLALSVLVPVAVFSSAMPRWAAWSVALLAVAIGLRMAKRESALPTLDVVVDAEGRATIDGISVDVFRIDWRGPLAFVAWRDANGRRCHRSLWPDTLPSATRRELRLAIRAGGNGQAGSSVAP